MAKTQLKADITAVASEMRITLGFEMLGINMLS